MKKVFKRYELQLEIDNHNYVDQLIICLARQGFAPYINCDKDGVCIEIDSTMLHELGENP